jgi:hypothetical protein
MYGLNILARTLSVPSPKGATGSTWQYHPRSDHHSKVACWGILFDLLQHSSLLTAHVANGRVIFGINHEMSDFRTRRKKNLDLVLATPAGRGKPSRETFADLAKRYFIQLSAEEQAILQNLPVLRNDLVAAVHLALEAKACMTEHLKARPRLYDELNSSHDAVHGAANMAIAAGFAMINVSRDFISPGLNRSWRHPSKVTHHDQPRVTERVIDKLHQIPRRASTGTSGFDAMAIVVVECANDGSRVKIVREPPAPQPGDPVSYEAMIARVAQLYESRFPHA